MRGQAGVCGVRGIEATGSGVCAEDFLLRKKTTPAIATMAATTTAMYTDVSGTPLLGWFGAGALLTVTVVWAERVDPPPLALIVTA